MDLQSPPQFLMEPLDYGRPDLLLGEKENATATARDPNSSVGMVVSMMLMGIILAHISVLSSRPGSARWNDGGSSCGHMALDHETLLASCGRFRAKLKKP
jgi:hypothetical protein